jgi:hypothetical protein
MQCEALEGVRLDELRVTSCRFPLGGPFDRVELFCGKPTVAGCSWCSKHRKRVFSRSTLQKPKIESAEGKSPQANLLPL